MTADEPTPTRAWFVAIVATLTMAVSYVDRQTLAALSPMVTHSLGIGNFAYGWVQGAFSWAYLFGAPLAGRWIDRRGARRGLLVAMLVWSAIAAMHAFVPGLVALVLLRLALGAAESPGFPGAAQCVQRILPPTQRAAGFGFLFTGSSIGAVIAPVVALQLALQFGWRASFAGTAIVGLLWIPLWMSATAPASVRKRLDEVTADVGAGPYRSGAVSVGRTAPELLRLVLHPGVLRAVIVVITSAPIIAFNLLWIPKYLVEHFHRRPSQLASILWIPPLLFDVGAVAFGALASLAERRHPEGDGPHRILFAMAALLGAGAAAAPWVHSPLGATVVLSIAGLGVGGIYTIITSDMLARVPVGAISAAGGLTAAAQSLAYVIANPLVGFTVRDTHGYERVIWGLAALLVPGAITWLVWTPPRRTQTAASVTVR